jgi:hypothetical protein
MQNHDIERRMKRCATPSTADEHVLGSQTSEDGCERLEVALVRRGRQSRLELRVLGWGDGIGWYVQRRISLDPLQIRALKGILGTARVARGGERALRRVDSEQRQEA